MKEIYFSLKIYCTVRNEKKKSETKNDATMDFFF